MSRTKDEKFVVCLYETALAAGDVYGTFSRYGIGDRVHLHPKAVDTICKLLLQANFIKKAGEEDIYLTKNGEELAVRILKE